MNNSGKSQNYKSPLKYKFGDSFNVQEVNFDKLNKKLEHVQVENEKLIKIIKNLKELPIAQENIILESKLSLAMQIIEKLEEIQSELIAVAELHADHTFEKINQVEELKKGLR